MAAAHINHRQASPTIAPVARPLRRTPARPRIERGEVPEWLKGSVLKTDEAKVSGSSNLPLSAMCLPISDSNLRLGDQFSVALLGNSGALSITPELRRPAGKGKPGHGSTGKQRGKRPTTRTQSVGSRRHVRRHAIQGHGPDPPTGSAIVARPSLQARRRRTPPRGTRSSCSVDTSRRLFKPSAPPRVDGNPPAGDRRLTEMGHFSGAAAMGRLTGRPASLGRQRCKWRPPRYEWSESGVGSKRRHCWSSQRSRLGTRRSEFQAGCTSGRIRKCCVPPGMCTGCRR